MKKYLILFISLIGLQYAVKSQDNPLHIQVIPPSPNAASLGKYGEIPVNYYTGTPGINIPIYDLSAGDITVPISLSYHASGIKVEEVASWVGLGWSLNAGGVITRTMRGLPDEKQFSGILEHGLSVDDVLNANTDDQFYYLNQITRNQLDFEPDVFYFNFNGRAGRFYLEKENGQIIGLSVPYQDISIKKNSDETWTIIDEQGFRYTFGEGNAKDRTINDRQGTGATGILAFNSAWYLTKIISPNNDSVTFTYDSYTINYCQKSHETSFYLNSHISIPGCTSDRSQKSYSDVEVAGARIKSVTSQLGTINFIADDQERLDIKGDSALYAIEIRNLQGNLKKRFELNYDYFVSTSSLSNDYCSGNQDYRKYRLKLLSIQEKVDGNNFKPPYSFTYNAKRLPERLSNAQDHWGFYNGKVNNESLVPSYRLEHPLSGTILNLPGANRTASNGYMQAAMLKQIKYPTGGTTDFEFEPHEALVPATFLWETEQTIDGDSLYASVRGVDAGRERVVFADFTVDVPPELAPNYIDPGLMMKIQINGQEGCEFGIRDGSNACGIAIEIYNDTGELAWAAGGTVGSNHITNRFLGNGNYRLLLEILDPANLLVDHFVVSVRGPKNTPVFSGSDPSQAKKNIKIGGLRIVRIISQDSVSEAQITRFTYEDESNPDRSSGFVVTEPIYGYNYRSDDNCWDFARTATSNVTLGTTQGGHVGYKHVQVDYGENGENGKSKFRYTTVDEYPDRLDPRYPFAPAESFDWRRGLLLKRVDFKKHANGYQKIREVSNDYEIENITAWKNRKKGLKAGCQGLADNKCALIAFKQYWISTGWYYLSKVHEITYDQSDVNDSLIIERQFFYDRGDFHVMPSSQTQSTSNGQTIETRFKYPLDYDSASVAIDSLVKRHILAPVIEQTQWVDGKLVSGKATKYKIEGQIVVPEKVYLIETTGGLTGISESMDGENFDVNFKERAGHLYDANGNLIQVRKTNDVPTSYLWGYNVTLPVVQAIGIGATSLQNAVAGAVNSLPGYSNGLGDLDVLLSDIEGLDTESKRSTWRDFNTALRDLIGEAQVTTFTYDPLVGMTSQTDPNRIIMRYEYDELNRLKLMRDHEDNILQQYEYHYHDEGQ